jgi:hypothetical protein
MEFDSGMRLPQTIATDTEHRWLSTTEAQRYFSRSQATIAKWIANGTCIEFGFRIFRDITGHYWIGIPISQITHNSIPSNTEILL